MNLIQDVDFTVSYRSDETAVVRHTRTGVKFTVNSENNRGDNRIKAIQMLDNYLVDSRDTTENGLSL